MISLEIFSLQLLEKLKLSVGGLEGIIIVNMRWVQYKLRYFVNVIAILHIARGKTHRCNISKPWLPSGRIYDGVSPWQGVVFMSYDMLHNVCTQSQFLLSLTYSHDASTHMNVSWLFIYAAMLLVLSPILRPEI